MARQTESPDLSAKTDNETVTDTTATAGEVWKPTPGEVVEYKRMTFEDRAAITSFQDALDFAAEAGTLIGSDALGDGFKILTEKKQLVGKTFVVVDWEYGKNVTMGEKFVIVRLVTKDDEKFIITDGSTGIMRQLEMLLELSKGKYRSVMCTNGLRASDFWVAGDDEPNRGEIVPADFKGKKKMATTYYIDQV